ncbi:MAG: hypothetical protein OER90_19185 [Gemmatimonadota bacterium]|nr:hypothetical protein [Gemmatimonadota bacterium]
MGSGRLIRIVGWLLTPAVVWAASFLGGWIGAIVGARVSAPERGIYWLVGGSVIAGSAGLVVWVVRLRHRTAELSQHRRSDNRAASNDHRPS